MFHMVILIFYDSQSALTGQVWLLPGVLAGKAAEQKLHLMIKKLKRGLLLEGLLKGTCLLNGACLLKGACVLTGACLLKGVIYYEEHFNQIFFAVEDVGQF